MCICEEIQEKRSRRAGTEVAFEANLARCSEKLQAGVAMNGIARARTRVETAGVAVRVGKTRVYLHANSVLLHERLVQALAGEKNLEVVTQFSSLQGTDESNGNDTTRGQILVLFSSGLVTEDLHRIHGWRMKTRELKVLLLGASWSEMDFLQYVRSGVHGFLSADATAREIVAAVQGLSKGEAVCGGQQCAFLFHYLEKEIGAFPSAALHRDLGLTRRDQQLIPLLTRGLTNKEIANHFSLSEQTVKNHLYRMKRKVGAHGRLEIVDVCRQHGFLA